MASNLTPTLIDLKNAINKETMIVLKIQGSQYLYGTSKIMETARWDDPRINWDNEIGVTWDGEIEKDNSKPYIMIKNSDTTKSLTSQLIVDKGGAGSVQGFTVELVDYRGEVAQDLSFDQIGDPLGNKATVYSGLVGGKWPQDFIPINRGYIDGMKYKAGSISISVALNTNLARQSAFEQYQGLLTSAIDSTQTTIPVNTSEIIESQDAITTFIRIDDEIMEVVGATSTTLEVIRNRQGTFNVSHDLETEITSKFQLAGHPLDLALKLLLSKTGNEFSLTGFNISALNRISSTELVDGAIIVDEYDIERESGATEGDLLNLIGTASNDGIKTITGFGQLDTGKSYILVDDLLSEETGLTIELELKSKYNVLPDGVGLDLDYVEVSEFEANKVLYSASFIEMDIPLKDTVENVRDLIIQSIFRPQGIYLVPRQAKTSCKVTSPPFSVEDIPILNTKNLTKISNVAMERATHKYLLNSIVFKYNEGILTDKFFDRFIRVSTNSTDRIEAGRKRMEIEAPGLTRSPETTQFLESMTNRILNRYRFASRYISNLNVLYSVGMNIEIGDIVYFGGEDTQLVNLQTGERDLPVAQYEVINKKLDIVKGGISLQCLETGFGIDGIYAVYSPASEVAPGSTVDRLILGELWESTQFSKERDKWDKWIGLKIRVRSEDYTYDEITTLKYYDQANENGIYIDALPSLPLEGYIVELAKYTDYSASELEELAKLSYTFNMDQSSITLVNGLNSINVVDSNKFGIGMEIQVHSEDYSRDSETRIIDDIVGSTLILDNDLDITPEIEDKVEIYSYSEAKGYRYL